MSPQPRPPDAGVLPDTRGLNVYRGDRSLRQLLDLYLPVDLRTHLEPHLDRLGAMVTGRLDELAHTADRNPPVLHLRDRQGNDRQWLEKHPAYEEMESIAFGEFGLAAMSHRGGVLGWPQPLPPAVKYALTYLFVQAEFGLCCPVSMTDSLTRTLRMYAGPELLDRFLPSLTATDIDVLCQGAMFITEQGAGSDVGSAAAMARKDDKGDWRLYGDKWFCSNPDAGLVLVLARPEGAQVGTRGLGLFLMPRRIDGVDGENAPNAYRIIRLKDKLGSRSMASAEIVMEGAVAYLVGDMGAGFKQMTEMINVSRLSNGVRAAGLMRRALHEALYVARNRLAFGCRLADLPLMRRQLLKLLLPTEQALSFAFYTAEALARADEGDASAKQMIRILTPLIKFRACRDARKVTGDSMEVRGGSGYIEEWVNPRLLRDAHLGSIWEGTSNIVALDVLRAARKSAAHRVLAAYVRQDLAAEEAVPRQFRERLEDLMERSLDLIDRAAGTEGGGRLARQAASALYGTVSAAVLAREGARLGQSNGDAGRLMLARLVVDHQLTASDPLAADDPQEMEAAWALLEHDGAPVPLAKAVAFVSRA